MIETLLALALHLPDSTNGTGGQTVSDSTATSREVSLQRPSRGAYSSAIRKAATVPARHRAWAACVLDRESGGTLDRKHTGENARNPESTAAGRWQFLKPWQHGGSFMVKDRLVRYGMPQEQARKVREYLAKTPINLWDGYWQDILFNEAVHRGGKHHWNGGSC